MTLLNIRIPPRGRLMREKPGNSQWRQSDIETTSPQDEERDRRGSKHYVEVTADMDRKTQSRFALKPLQGRTAVMPPFDNGAIVEGRTIYTSTVVDPVGQQILKSGFNQAKIGKRVLKGKWKGMPIYCLTLEERKTCPTDCAMWRPCFGNGMHRSVRFRHGPELESGLRREVADLARTHPAGFVVRLHILGDFYSVEYVRLWAELIARHRELNVFGYSARWGRDDPIAQELLVFAMENWDRFAIRFSNAPIDTCSTITIDHPGQVPDDSFICPEQLGKTESCGTCAACWDGNKRVAFIRH